MGTLAMDTVLPDTVRGNTNVEFVSGMVMFMIVGFLMAFSLLMAGKLLRPKVAHPEKDAPYECGEPAIGSSWVQFDLRFYVVALVFIVFDVEIVMFWPWAVIFREAGLPALYDMLFFFGVIVVGFLYLWRFGYLDWVRASTGQPEEVGHRRADEPELNPAVSTRTK